LVPYDITVGQFIYVIRKRIRLPASSALFLFVGEDAILLPINLEMLDVYHRYKNKDGFLYILYSKENVFG
jgi:GABA(A) receptor-associated protein